MLPFEPRHFVDANQPMASPPDAREPAAWGGDHGAAVVDEKAAWDGERRRNARRGAPAVEPLGGRKRVDTGAPYVRMLAEVGEYVGERVADLARRSQGVPVPPIGPKCAVAREELVDVKRDANRQALHAPRERALVARFDDEVDMIALDGELQQAKPLDIATRCARQGESHRGKYMLAAQHGQPRAQSDMNRLGRAMNGTR